MRDLNALEQTNVAGGMSDDDEWMGNTEQVFDDGSTLLFDSDGNVIGATPSREDNTSCYGFADLVESLVGSAIENFLDRNQGISWAVSAYNAMTGTNASQAIQTAIGNFVRSGQCAPQDFRIQPGS